MRDVDKYLAEAAEAEEKAAAARDLDARETWKRVAALWRALARKCGVPSNKCI
jgi:hypothetical protein